MNDADILTAQLNSLARQERALRQQGICTHGWRQGLESGHQRCNDCGKIALAIILDEERREALI